MKLEDGNGNEITLETDAHFPVGIGGTMTTKVENGEAIDLGEMQGIAYRWHIFSEIATNKILAYIVPEGGSSRWKPEFLRGITVTYSNLDSGYPAAYRLAMTYLTNDVCTALENEYR